MQVGAFDVPLDVHTLRSRPIYNIWLCSPSKPWHKTLIKNPSFIINVAGIKLSCSYLCLKPKKLANINSSAVVSRFRTGHLTGQYWQKYLQRERKVCKWGRALCRYHDILTRIPEGQPFCHRQHNRCSSKVACPSSCQHISWYNYTLQQV